MSPAPIPDLLDPQLDAIVVGGGFAGTYLLHALREANFSVKLLEAGTYFGGVWNWNCYPGARSDGDYNVYQYSQEEVYKDWTWKERFASQTDLQAYFRYVDQKWDLSRDAIFNTKVTAAEFDSTSNRWTVHTDTGLTAHPRFLLMCTGYAFKPLHPDLKNRDSFKGTIVHTSRWPKEGIQAAGNRIGVIGTGASGVQIIQELGPQASHLTVFQRTPNLALPMVQRQLDKFSQDKMKKSLYPIIFRRRLQTFGGMTYTRPSTSIWDETPEKVRLDFEEIWAGGGFGFTAANYGNIMVDSKANDLAYRFWREKALERINDLEMQKKLAPEIPPHPFGARRTSLEQTYFEVYNLPHVDLVDIRENPILEMTEKGVKTTDGVEHELDILVTATGFDAVTGSLTSIDIKGTGPEPLAEKWKKHGLSTYLAMASSGFPNMIFSYGPQGPTGFCNGPTCAEVQGDWIVACLKYMREHGHTRIEATSEAEEGYVKIVNSAIGLWRDTKSWWNGGNVPGKRVEVQNFMAGLPAHMKLLMQSAENGYEGFVLS